MRQTGLGIIITLVIASYPLTTATAIYLRLDFSLDRQTYNWSDSVSVLRKPSAKTEIQFQNRSAASLMKKSVFGGGDDRWQKTARSSLVFTSSLRPGWKGGLQVSQDFDRLEQKRFIADRALAFAGYEGRHLSLLQRGGIVWEERRFEPLRNVQAGLGYSAEVSLTPRADTAFGRFAATGEVTTLRQTPRKAIGLSYDLRKQSAKGDTIDVSASQSFGERKYFPASGSFDATARQRTEQRRWDFHATRTLPARLAVTANAAYRFDSYDYQYEQTAADFVRQNNNFTSLFEYQLSVARRFGSLLSLQGTYLFNRTNEDFGALQTNQRAETGQLGMTAVIVFFVADTLELSGQMGVTSYFAPTSSTFFADRDRSASVATFRLTHRFSDFLTGGLDGSYRGFHTVYISGSLSANNNVNNVYILNPTLIWKPFEPITLEQNYQMHANYVYYEYEKSDFSGRSTLYRRANLTNKLTIALSRRTDFIIEYGYRYEDFGRLVYSDQWQQQVSWDRRTHRPRLSVDYHPTSRFHFQPYAAYEVQTSYDHLFDPLNTLGRRQQSEQFIRRLIGFDLQWTLSDHSAIDCKLQRRVQDYQHQRNQEYDLFTIAIRRYL
jgi:hypothetical protein